MAKDKPIVGFPCAGERMFGGTQNHELVFVAPYHLAVCRREAFVSQVKAC
jgi:uncharacterized protein (DUF169 family)